MSNLIDGLAAKGWFLTEEGLATILDDLEKDDPTVDDVVSECLNADLRHITKSHLARDVSSVGPPLVLQLHSTINLATPAQHQTPTPRLLQLTLTDGARKLRAVEILGPVQGLSLSTPPGTKLSVERPIEVRDGLLLVGDGELSVLGGTVDAMLREWRAGRQFIKRTRAPGRKDGDKENEEDDGPPLFVPFTVKSKPPPPPVQDVTPTGQHRQQSAAAPAAREDKPRHKDATGKQQGQPEAAKGGRGRGKGRDGGGSGGRDQGQGPDGKKKARERPPEAGPGVGQASHPSRQPLVQPSQSQEPASQQSPGPQRGDGGPRHAGRGRGRGGPQDPAELPSHPANLIAQQQQTVLPAGTQQRTQSYRRPQQQQQPHHPQGESAQEGREQRRPDRELYVPGRGRGLGRGG